eukprot:379697-Pyramimonas_sp.AAC.1
MTAPARHAVLGRAGGQRGGGSGNRQATPGMPQEMQSFTVRPGRAPIQRRSSADGEANSLSAAGVQPPGDFSRNACAQSPRLPVTRKNANSLCRAEYTTQRTAGPVHRPTFSNARETFHIYRSTRNDDTHNIPMPGGITERP